MPPVGGPRDPHVLAIDLGTSAVKVALVSTGGAVADGEREPLQVRLLPQGGAEQSPEAWWRAIVRAAGRLLDRRAAAPDDVVAVNASVQWSGTVAVGRSGEPLADAIIWMDSRGAPHVRRITGGPVRIQGYGVGKLITWVRLTGGAPTHSGKDSLAHVLWLRHERPEVYREAFKLLEPKDYLNLRLTGRAAATFDSITLHWVTDNRNLSRVDYHPTLLRLAGLDREKLPDLVPPASVLGPLRPEVADELGLPRGVPVASGMPDLLAAAVGSGAVRDFEAHLTVGSSSWLVCHVPWKRTDLFHNMAALPSGIPGRYLLTNEQESAGACLAWLRDRVLFPEGPRPDFAWLDREAEGAPAGAGGVIFTPWLNGERTPVDDRTVRGSFFNHSLETTRAHLVRAVLEGVALNARWLLRTVERFLRRPVGEVAVVGGGARSDLWCQILADVLGRRVRRVADPDFGGARGAALQAALALGELTVEEIPDRVPVERTFEPDPANGAVYDDLFREFVGLYRRNRRAHARLNGGR